MFLAVLLLVSQVLLHLFATSVVTAAAFDTAGRIAVIDRGCGPSGATADVVARGRLGRYGQGPEVDVRCDDEVAGLTRVTISAPSPARALATERFGLGLDRIERSAAVRTEQATP